MRTKTPHDDGMTDEERLVVAEKYAAEVAAHFLPDVALMVLRSKRSLVCRCGLVDGHVELTLSAVSIRAKSRSGYGEYESVKKLLAVEFNRVSRDWPIVGVAAIKLIVLHELAHAVNQSVNGLNPRPHGVEFCKTFSTMVRRYQDELKEDVAQEARRSQLRLRLKAGESGGTEGVRRSPLAMPAGRRSRDSEE